MDHKQRLLELRRLGTLIKIYSNFKYPSVILNHKGNVTILSFTLIGLLFSFVDYGILLGVIAYFLLAFITPKQSFNERAFKILAGYEPILQFEYESFLHKIKNDSATYNDLLLWMAGESKCLKQVPESEALAKAELLSKLK
ncbi:MAG: hypothetical protein EOO52_13105 [Gammaproteobacteria bacterium]|nr:MAG: hypothetical protein EOO52_13105 [Gammaproteobacteria bacterium]